MAGTNSSRLSYFELIIIMAAGKIVWTAYGLADPLVQRPLTSWTAMGLIAILGYLALNFSKQAGIPDLWSPSVSNIRRFLLPAGFGFGFGILQIGLVLLQRIQVPMVPFPLSIPVYISVGILSELVLHFIPLAGILYSITLIREGEKPGKTTVWTVLILISLWEPVLQVYMMLQMNLLPAPAAAVLPFLLIWAANLLPLYFLKRYGLLAAVSWRLADYFVWHILWGMFSPAVLASL